MIDAYATGYGVEYDTYGLPASKGGLSPVVGFTRPVASHRKWRFLIRSDAYLALAPFR